MKKIYTIIAILFLAINANAQTAVEAVPHVTSNQQPVYSPNHNPPISKPNHEKALGGVAVDYYYADSVNAYEFGGYYSDRFTNSGLPLAYMWDVNSNYKLSNHDTSIAYVIVAFDTIVDPWINALTYPNASYDYSTITSVTIDSIWIQGGQQNLSLAADTLICQIINVNATANSMGLAGYPDTTSPILFSDTLIIPADSSISLTNSNNNSWLWYSLISFNNSNATFPHTLPSGVQKYAVKIKYYGAIADTFGMLAGYPYSSFCGSSSTSAAAQITSYDTIVPNSMAFYTRFDSLMPSGHGFLLYYDCNGDHTYDAGDGQSKIEDFRVVSFLDLTGDVGIKENTFTGNKLFQNVPNPFNSTTNITYQLANAGTVTMNITDLAGRVIKTFDEGLKVAGKYSITIDSKDLEQGIYFNTLNVDGITLTNKIVVAR